MAYWILAIAVTLFGIISGFTIGLPILVVGVTMLALGPLRGRPLVFWPPLNGVLAAVVTFMAIAPFSCSATLTTEGATPADTVCTSLIGLRYTARALENPSLMPALLVAVAVGVVVALATFAILSRRTTPEHAPA
jgi:hypothetical protein